MAGNLTENFNEICRLCASKINLTIGIGINIFQGEGTVREISKKISTCLPIQVHEADRLPKMICGDCIYKLDVCFHFHEKCLNTENLLIELIRSNNTTNLEKMRDTKNTDLVVTVDERQMQIVQTPPELLDHSNLTLSHRDNIIVGQQMILNTHDNIDIQTHELENIEIAPHELNPHGIAHNNIHAQQLDLHHEPTMAQLVQPEMQMPESHLTVQNLELIHSQHNLMTSHYETLHSKNIASDDSCVGNNILTLKKQRDDSTIKVEDVKSENQPELVVVKTTFSDASETESSIDGDFDSNLDNSGEIEKPSALDNNIYDQNNYILSTSEPELGAPGLTETGDYYCNVCGKSISDKDEYLEHYGEHLNKCLICQEDFSNLEEVLAHRKQVHQQNSDKTEQSTSKATRPRTKSTVKDSLDDNFFKEESSEDEKNLSEFMNENDEDDENDMDDNEDNKNGKRKRWEPKVCKECGKTYKTNYKLAEHMRKHTGEQPFKCTMCDKAFRSKIGLAQHEAKHTGNYDYSCPTCGKGFQCKSYLIVHQRVHSTLKPYPCSQCGRNFKTKQSLLDHMNRHLGVKPFMCEICGRGFITKGLCKSHQKVHSGRDNRQFPCTVCNKLFVSKSYLATHLRIHTGEKPFICEVCGKGFLTRVDLRIHSTMHTGEKSYVCEMCGKAFARRDALRCHRRSHTGERPYRCDICGQTFTQFSPMAIHKRLHTGERPYTCEVCNRSFVSRSTMMSHRKKHVP